jgi:GrpB-like predicted nucleotidyltransferase (UPF0157 family)
MSQFELSPYRRKWYFMYLKERLMLHFLFLNQKVEIAHIGSTAVSGMVAKPIIDILVAVVDYEDAFRCIQDIEQLGYRYQGENSQLRKYYFKKGRPTRYSLYVLERKSLEWQQKIKFRDLLRSNPALSADYAASKRRLASMHPEDLQAYQLKKGQYIRKVLREHFDKCCIR